MDEDLHTLLSQPEINPEEILLSVFNWKVALAFRVLKSVISHVSDPERKQNLDKTLDHVRTSIEMAPKAVILPALETPKPEDSTPGLPHILAPLSSKKS